MSGLKRLLFWNRDAPDYAGGLDLGDGKTLPPEDVLDGHSMRLLANRRRPSRTVPVQVDDDLSAAITVMAPDLAPLADLAQEVAVAVPAVQPEPDFRQNLYEALERTHRQYRIQEMLGTRSAHQPGLLRVTAPWMALGAVLCVIGVSGWLLLRRKDRRQTNKLAILHRR